MSNVSSKLAYHINSQKWNHECLQPSYYPMIYSNFPVGPYDICFGYRTSLLSKVECMKQKINENVNFLDVL